MYKFFYQSSNLHSSNVWQSAIYNSPAVTYQRVEVSRCPPWPFSDSGPRRHRDFDTRKLVSRCCQGVLPAPYDAFSNEIQNSHKTNANRMRVVITLSNDTSDLIRDYNRTSVKVTSAAPIPRRSLGEINNYELLPTCLYALALASYFFLTSSGSAFHLGWANGTQSLIEWTV